MGSILLAFLTGSCTHADTTGPAVPPDSEPVAIVKLDPPSTNRILAGGDHTCLLTPQSRLLCWGAASATGNPSGDWHPAWLSGPSFVAASAGDDFTCGLDADGRAYCWGGNAWGQLGDGSRADRATPNPVNTTLRFFEVSAGGNTACGLVPDGRAFCWGRGEYGVLGDGIDTLGHARMVPNAVRTDHRFTHVDLGFRRACAIGTDGNTYCWGVNGPTAGAAVAAASSAADTTCINTYDAQALHCASPIVVGAGHQLVSIAAGDASDCGIDATGVGYCWGLSQWGTLGDGDTSAPPQRFPVRISIDRSLVAVTGGSLFMCALATDQTVWCWGNNFRGTLGIGSTSGGSFVPVAVVGGLHFAELSSGGIHTCGIATDESVYCWGINLTGQAGLPPTTADVPAPVRVELPP